MNLERVEEIANAVLYEGYMLYPYRPSAIKNQQRFNFGVLCPPAYCDLQRGSESHFLHTECLFRAVPSTRLTVKVRFLQIVQRSIGQYCSVNKKKLEFVDSLEVDGRPYQPWQEAAERSITYDGLNAEELLGERRMDFTVPAEDSREELRGHDESLGAIIRHSEPLVGTVHLQAAQCRDNIFKFTVQLENRTPFDVAGADPCRDAALPHSMISAHIVLGIDDGEFLSLLDPPEAYEDLARACQNVGNWPVLASDDAKTMLASPIILYDHPKIAPESAGNLFDSTEIDEILSLRILTLTEEEKAEIRQTDDRARELLERTENIPDEQFMKLHGVLRGLTVHKEEPA